MTKHDDNIELSYQMQLENYEKKDEETARLMETWFEEDTVDYWRHFRMVEPLKPLIDRYKNTKWVTIGDGRFGLDSIRLKKIQPALDVLPTDISPSLLQEAKEKKIISDYKAENAEHLSFADNSFDFSFCKEAFHHFPRPYIALYEMLRVSRLGVIFIEPNERKDKKIPDRIFNVVKRAMKRIIGKPVLHPETWNFEVSGNYIYTLSKNEMEKVGLGLQLPAVAFHFYNDYYEQGVEYQKATPGNELFEKVKKMIANEDLKCRLGLQTYQGIIAILFKVAPDAELRRGLMETGFQIVNLPENPYQKKRKEETAKHIS